jgi:hypothetical protein
MGCINGVDSNRLKCPKGVYCLVDPIWHEEGHDYDAATGACRRICECTGCGIIVYSEPHPCEGKGDGCKCWKWFEEAKKIADDLDAHRSSEKRVTE